jgi:uncharacterized protein (TIGR02996 family)
MTTLDALLAGIVAEPREEARWLVLADWLDEYDDPRRAEVLRLHRKLIATCRAPDAHPERAAWQARMVEFLVAGVVPCVPRHTLTLSGGVPLVGAFVPPGAFLMGGTVDESEEPVHEVTIADGFIMGVYPVTQAQWEAVTGTNPSHFKGPNRPAENVSWDDAHEFCAKVNALRLGATVRLPREAEWEYACRAGTTTHYHFGDVLNTDLANYDGTYSWNGSPKGAYREETTDAGAFAPNGWGLHDVHGNVWEWCEDVYRSYAGENESDIQSRVLRGGSWRSSPDVCRAAYRIRIAPAPRNGYFGCRVCFRLD